MHVDPKALARRLAPHLFGGPVRLHGRATWARLESGAKKLKEFEITDCTPLNEAPFSKLFDGLRARMVPPEKGRLNPVHPIRELREE